MTWTFQRYVSALSFRNGKMVFLATKLWNCH